MMDSNVEIDVLSKLRNLCSTLADKIESDTVSSDERALVNTTKMLLDFRSLSQNRLGMSPTALAHLHYPRFQQAVDKLKISS